MGEFIIVVVVVVSGRPQQSDATDNEKCGASMPVGVVCDYGQKVSSAILFGVVALRNSLSRCLRFLT